MTDKKMDGIEIWKQFEDLLIPGLRLSVLKLHGMQFAEERTAGGGFFAVAVRRGEVGERRVERAAAGAGKDGGREDAASGEWGKVNREWT